MGRAPCCSKVGLNRGPWSIEEDKLLIHYIQTHGEGHWRALPSKAGLLRCGKSCRLRWVNYLRPGVKRGNFTPEENDTIIRLHSLHGNRWSLIAAEFPGRTDNEIKNHWNTHLRKQAHLDKNAANQPNVIREKVEDIDHTSHCTSSIVESTKVMDLLTTSSCEEEEDEEDQQEDQQKQKDAADHNYQPPRFQNSMAMEQTKPESTKVNPATPTSSGASYSSSTITEGEVNMVTDTFFYELDDLIDVDQNINGCYCRDDGTKQLERLYTEYLQLLNYEGE